MGKQIGPRLRRQIGIAQWILPFILLFIVVVYETYEHIIVGGEWFSQDFGVEVVFFGILGPTGIWLMFGWIRRSLGNLAAAQDQIHHLTHELEDMVIQRTRQLEGALAELAARNEELLELDRLKSEFVSLVSHELRAPLTNVNGGIELIMQIGEGLTPAQRDALQIIAGETTRLTSLVEDILNVSLLEAGRLTLRPGAVALAPLLAEVATPFFAPDGSHQLRLEVEHDLPFALADECYLRQVIQNLLDNAIKYSPADSQVTVQARAGGDGYLIISVADQGHGIRLEDQERIFDRFYRVDTGLDQEVYGHGLGLYFVHKLVEAQAGHIWVESAPDQGATFSFTLPLAAEAPDDEE